MENQSSSQINSHEIKPELKPDEKLNIMAENAKNQAGVNSFMSPGTKRARGRPKGSSKGYETGGNQNSSSMGTGIGAQPRSTPHIDPIAEIMPLTDTASKMYSEFLVVYCEDEKGRPSAGNEVILSHSMAASMHTFFPNAMGKYACVITMLAVGGMGFFNSWAIRRQKLEMYREEARQKNQGQGPQAKTQNNGQSGTPFMAN